MRAASVALAVLLAGCAAALHPDRPEPAAADAAHETLAYDIAESLVTEVGPRFAGSEGDRKAIAWAVQKLTVLGFDNVRAEPVTVPRWVRGEIAVHITAPRRQRLEAVALGGSIATPPQGIEAEVVRVESVDALVALPRRAVQGRIVFYAGRMERARDGAGYTVAAPMRRKGPAEAARKGARAVLIRSVGTGAHAFGHTGTTKYEADAPKIPAAALAQADADVLEQALADGSKVRVRLKLDARDAGEAQSANVIGEIPGTGDGIVLLGAHLDSWDLTPGANDDAAGVGIVIAAAQRAASLGRLRRTLRVVLFANEEFGAHGAKAYAQAHADELARHVVVMEADSGGGEVFRLDAAVADGDWPELRELAAKLGLEPGSNGKSGGVDVAPLRTLGVPELIATQDDTLYFDVHHTAADTLATLDRAGMAQATVVFAALARHAAERREPFTRLAPDTEP